MANNPDKWIEWYVGFRDALVAKYGVLAKSSKTGANLPRMQWADGLAVSLTIATELARAIDSQNAREKNQALGHSAFQTMEPFPRDVETAPFIAGYPLLLGWQDAVSHELAQSAWWYDEAKGTPVKTWASKFTAKEIDDADSTKRLCAVDGEWRPCQLSPRYESSQYWFSQALYYFDKLVTAPSVTLNSTDNIPGTGYLSIEAVELIMSAVYNSVLHMSVAGVVPTASWSQAGAKVVSIAEDAINAGADAVGRTAGWFAQQAGKAVGTGVAAALDQTGMYGLAVFAIGAYILIG